MTESAEVRIENAVKQKTDFDSVMALLRGILCEKDTPATRYKVYRLLHHDYLFSKEQAALLRGVAEAHLFGFEAWEIRQENMKHALARLRTLSASRPSETLDLSFTALNDVYFPKLNLLGASFYDSDLVGADLHGSTLQGTNFRRVDLSKANLQDCFIEHGGFNHAILKGTDLRRAYVDGSDFIGANFDGANLEGAQLVEVDLRGADLSKANMEGCEFKSGTYNRFTKWPPNFRYWEDITSYAASSAIVETPPALEVTRPFEQEG